MELVHDNLCPVCENGHCYDVMADAQLKWAGVIVPVYDLYYARCNNCGEEMAEMHAARINEEAYSDAKRRAEELASSAARNS